MEAFFENAWRIFDVARLHDGAEPQDFALLIRADGGLHFLMEDGLSAESAAISNDVRVAYRVTKTSHGGIRVTGRDENRECTLERNPAAPASGHRFSAELLRDQPLYQIAPPLPALTS